jgi:hypothetical protein
LGNNSNYITFVVEYSGVMQEDKDKVINNLKEKINTIISFFERTKEENNQLFLEKQELLAQNKEKDEKIKELEKALGTAKFASAIVSSDEEEVSEIKHDAKIKINRMVREIDRCISLLNKLN